uniref:Uncharacterized protein n=1 Tax=Iconisemion striatum TaxID=60296 RepID=A0A1A7XHS3_9TELE
MRVHTGQKELS